MERGGICSGNGETPRGGMGGKALALRLMMISRTSQLDDKRSEDQLIFTGSPLIRCKVDAVVLTVVPLVSTCGDSIDNF